MVQLSPFEGLWRDYSEAGLRQITLTLRVDYGGYLISTMTLLTSLAGSSLWTIMAYALHQFQVSHNKRCDPAILQIQALLRNDASAFSAIADAFSLSRAWDGTPFRPRKRLISVVSLATLLLVLPTLAGIFVSYLATRREENISVLAVPEECGGWNFNWTKLHTLHTETRRNPLSHHLNIIADDALDARLYAKQFNSDIEALSTSNSKLPATKLPYSVRMEPCPFAGEKRCLSNDTSSPNISMTWDSGMLNSHTHFGVNTPAKDRVNVRKILTCSPVNVDDLINSTMVDGIVVVELQRLFNWKSSLTLKFEGNRHTLNGYSARCGFFPGALKSERWAAEPFDRADGDLSLCFISQNSVVYPEAVYDPLFWANGSSVEKGADGEDVYFGNNYFNVIACLEQVQFCNPKAAKCTSISHPAAAYHETHALQLNINQQTTINRTAMLLGLTNVASLGVGSLGAAGLLARDQIYDDIISTSLPPDQWQKEASLWFETGLSLLQIHIIRFLGRIDQSSPHMYGRFLIYQPLAKLPPGPERDAARRNCYNQKIATTGRYQNFRVFELMLVFALCLCIIGMSLLLEPCVKLLRQLWVTRAGQSRELARDMDSKFWLQRIALESVGVGLWRRGGKALDSNIPVVDQNLVVEWPTEYGVDTFYKLKAGEGYTLLE